MLRKYIKDKETRNLVYNGFIGGGWGAMICVLIGAFAIGAVSFTESGMGEALGGFVKINFFLPVDPVVVVLCIVGTIIGAAYSSAVCSHSIADVIADLAGGLILVIFFLSLVLSKNRFSILVYFCLIIVGVVIGTIIGSKIHKSKNQGNSL